MRINYPNIDARVGGKSVLVGWADAGRPHPYLLEQVGMTVYLVRSLQASTLPCQQTSAFTSLQLCYDINH
jgi:hypothetical protein